MFDKNYKRWNILFMWKPFRFYFWTNLLFHSHFRIDIQKRHLWLVWFEKIGVGTKTKIINNGYYAINEDSKTHYHITEN